ncbi:MULTISPECIES: DUF2750 domain-containing protein [Ralstonia]|uniref:DUF2750 domain-containing protein n=1 Tax=Ralstonia TaxID=48736 RepID=UPI000C7E6D1B|nr:MULTISPECIES: DUF2750 domain-containing protein [Ralstonia]PLT18981.1 DUF2750 domain-containing protein [Ralstonia mannitolilytica]
MSIAAPHALAFYSEVAKSGLVWSVRDSKGFPAPLNPDGHRAMPFWSSESRALAIVRDVPAYADFLPVAISWAEFCERWVPGLIRDGLLAGVNWSAPNAMGFDVAPGDLQSNVEALRTWSI